MKRLKGLWYFLQGFWCRVSIALICGALKAAARKRGYKGVWIRWYGAFWIHPQHLVFWVAVRTDAEREKLKADAEYWEFARSLLDRYLYPREGHEGVMFGTESEETVDRETDGDWYFFFK